MIEIDLKEDATARLTRLAELLDDLTPVMDEIGEYMVEATKQRFVEGRGPDGVPWAPKRPATIEAARRNPLRGNDPRPLHGLGSLKGSIAQRAGPDHVEIGANRIYAGVMQFGADKGAFGATATGSAIPWGDIPARPFLGGDDDDRDAIAAIASGWIARAAGS